MKSSGKPGLGIDPKMDVLGKPVIDIFNFVIGGKNSAQHIIF